MFMRESTWETQTIPLPVESRRATYLRVNEHNKLSAHGPRCLVLDRDTEKLLQAAYTLVLVFTLKLQHTDLLTLNS